MKPCRIQFSGVFLTTPLIIMLIGAQSLLSSRTFAQPSCQGTMQTSTQTASFTGNGSNATYNPIFTQFFPPAGYTVMGLTLISKATVSATFDLTNNNTPPAPATIRPGVSLDDAFQFNGSPLTDDNGNTDEYITKVMAAPGTTLAPGASTSVSAPNLMNNVTMFSLTMDNSNPAMNDFIGMGSLDLSYNSSPGLSLIGVMQVNPTYVVNTTFTLSYTYCYTGTLAADILTFTAYKQDKQTVALNWLTANETPGRYYTVEVSNGSGSDFTDVTTIPADGSVTDANYAYSYVVRPGDNGKLFFRLKLTGADGSVAYSALREVDLGGSETGKFSIYPNPPSDFINLTIPGDSQDWQVDIIAADGSLVQRNYYRNSNTANVSFVRRLSAGTYFVRAVSPLTGKSYAASFLIR